MNAPCPPNPNFPPFPLNPTVGQRWLGWVWNGAQWVQTPATGMQVLTTVFVASGPYMPSPGLVSLTVECIGGGGGGGNCASPNATYIVAGGGGGSGGYSRKTLPASLVLGGVVITVGAGGGEGVSGLPGGPTSFGALCVANGGGGNNDTNVFGAAGPGASIGIGDLTQPGGPGTAGVVSGPTLEGVVGGRGGQMWGGAVGDPLIGVGQTWPGSPGTANTGAGGNGAVINQSTAINTTIIGGSGGSGVCIVTEYCWADVAPGEDCGCAPGGARIAGGFDEC